MKKMTAPPMTVLAIDLQTNLQRLKEDVGMLNVALFQEAIKAGFHPCGPQYWIYTWQSLDPKANFDLKIALPIAKFGGQLVNSKFHVETLKAFKHIAHTHNGDWEKLTESYNEIMAFVTANKLTTGATSREVYVNCDFENIENNRTEIQFEIA